MVPEDYVHRIGRTGRAGMTGQAHSLVCIDEARLLRDIEVVLGHPIDSEVIPGFEPDRSIRPEPILRGGLGRTRPMPANRGSHGPRPMNGPRPSGGPRPAPVAAHGGGYAPPRRPSGPTRPERRPDQSGGRPAQPNHRQHGAPIGRPLGQPNSGHPGQPSHLGQRASSPPSGAHRSPGAPAHRPAGPGTHRPQQIPGERLARSGPGPRPGSRPG